MIRTRRNPLRSRPSPYLVVAALAVVALAVLLPFTALGRWFGFVAPPPSLLAALAGMLLCYLALAEAVKRWFYRRQPPQGSSRAAVLRPHLPFARPPV